MLRIPRPLGTPIGAAALLAAALLIASPAGAHCDALDGPVVVEARAALDANEVAPVLKWVAPSDEAEIREAFSRTVEVRKAGGAARDLADRWFLETLVRVHRASEGAPFTGLKPAGTPVDPAVRHADRALESGSADTLIKAISSHVADGLRERFENAAELRRHADESVAAGRAYVAAYVEFVHYAERIHNAATGAAPPHTEHAH